MNAAQIASVDALSRTFHVVNRDNDKEEGSLVSQEAYDLYDNDEVLMLVERWSFKVKFDGSEWSVTLDGCECKSNELKEAVLETVAQWESHYDCAICDDETIDMEQAVSATVATLETMEAKGMGVNAAIEVKEERSAIERTSWLLGDLEDSESGGWED